ncbi:hypothetical protein J3P77_07995 [Pseudomonas sp. R1-18]|uniref:hypothetical protein n=1 Tax=Pseudomonas sp. R1-18 TaxID=1632772 RepID=UPI003DA80203
MTYEKNGQFVSLTARLNARLEEKRLQRQACQQKLTDALDMTRACVLATSQIRPEVVDETLKFTDTYIAILRNAVRAVGGGEIEITVAFPEGKIVIDKFSQ